MAHQDSKERQATEIQRDRKRYREIERDTRDRDRKRQRGTQGNSLNNYLGETDRDRKRYRETVSNIERQKEIQRDRHKEKNIE